MANPTTNYSFAMPTNTDLVKDLPADFDIFGQAVDDRIKALNPETTAGDISYRSSTANTNTRLALGTAGQLLQVNSGATAPEWATISTGGITLISTTSLTGASVTLSSIPQTYNKLYLVIENYQPATDGSALLMRFNGVSTTTYREASPTLTSQQLSKGHNDNLGGTSGFCKTDNTNVLGFGFIEIFDYTNTTTNKLAVYQSFTNDEANPTTTWRIAGASGTSTATTAITSLVFLPASGNFTSGSIRLYGVK